MKPYSDVNDPRLIKALGHPLRVRILAVLETRDLASPNELATELGASLGVVSYHVRRLHALGLLELVKRTPRRGAIEHHYRATARPRVTDAGWEQTPALVKQAMVGASLQRIGGHVEAAASHGRFAGEDAHLSRRVMTLDARGWSEVARASQRWVEALERIERESAERLRDTRPANGAAPAAPATRAGAVLMLFAPSAADDGAQVPA